MTTTQQQRARYDFFRAHAGGIVGRNAIGALELARAEELLDEAEDLETARFQWVDDPEPYDPGDAATAEEAARYFDENTWTGPYGAVLEVNGAELRGASLWGVVLNGRGTDDPYARVVRAELALELAEELAGAIVRAQVRSLAEDLADRIGAAQARDLLAGALELEQVTT